MKFINTNKRAGAVKEYPGAFKIIKVDGGYIAFDNSEDLKNWKNQK